MENCVKPRKYKLLVMANPVDGKEDAFNDWYSNHHLGEVLSVDGFVGAQRFRMRQGNGQPAKWSYAAIYEIEGKDPQAALAALQQKVASGEIHHSETLDFEEVSLLILDPITALVHE